MQAPGTGRRACLLLGVAWLTGCAATQPAGPSYVAQSNAAALAMPSPTLALNSAGALQSWLRGPGTTNLGLSPVVVFQDGTGTLSYHAPTFADLPNHTEVRDVQGKACESGLQIPWGALARLGNPGYDALAASVGWGDSGFRRALRDAADQVAPDALLYDIRVDLQSINILSIWRQSCLVVTASAVTRLPEEVLDLPLAPATPPAAPAVQDANTPAALPPEQAVPAPAAQDPAAPGAAAAPVPQAQQPNAPVVPPTP